MRRRLAVAAAVGAMLASAVGAAWATNLNVSSKRLTHISPTTPVFFPESVSFTNKKIAGDPEKGDIVTLAWSDPIDEPTLCAGWSNAVANRTINLTWTITPGAGGASHDTMAVTGAIPAPCAGGFNVGSLDLGTTGYAVGGTVSFATTTALAITATTSTLTITLGNLGGTGTDGTVVNGGAAIWNPGGTVTDRSGRSGGNSNAASTSTTIF